MENLFKKFQYCSKFKALKLEKHHFHTKPPYKKTNTAWKVFKYGVISGSYFPVFGLNTDIYFYALALRYWISTLQVVSETIQCYI